MTAMNKSGLSEELRKDPVYLPHEVAQYFGVHVKTVIRWAKEGRLRSFRTPGDEYRFRASMIEQFKKGWYADHVS